MARKNVNPDGTEITVVHPSEPSPTPPEGGVVVMDETVALVQRPFIDFQGAGVTAADDSVSGKTVVTIPGGGGSGGGGNATYRRAWDSTVSYVAGDLVTQKGILWSAVQASTNKSPDGRISILASSTASVYNAQLGGPSAAQAFVPAANMTVNRVSIRYETTNATAKARRIGIASAVGTAITWMGYVDTNHAVTAGDVISYNLPADLALVATTTYYLVIEGGAHEWSVQTDANAIQSGVTTGDILHGAGFATALATYETIFWLEHLGPEYWTPVVEPAVLLNPEKNAVIPADVSDSWIVGAQQTDSPPAGQRVRAFFSKGKGYFRSGEATSTQWDTGNSGVNSFATGINSVASGAQAFACGNSSSASGANAHAEGQATIASGGNAHAEGQGTEASGVRSHAEGLSTVASGHAAHAEGGSTQATAYTAHAEGDTTRATANSSHAGGAYALASRFGQWARAGNQFATPGDMQYCSMPLAAGPLTDATARVATADRSATITTAGISTNVLTIGTSRVMKVKVNMVARRTDVAGEAAGFTWEGVVARDATGNARIVGAPVSSAWGDAPATDTWSMTVGLNTADVNANYLTVTVAGQAGKTTRWSGNIEWVEVG